jgi:hypothetical protein
MPMKQVWEGKTGRGVEFHFALCFATQFASWAIWVKLPRGVSSIGFHERIYILTNKSWGIIQSNISSRHLVALRAFIFFVKKCYPQKQQQDTKSLPITFGVYFLSIYSLKVETECLLIWLS